MNNRGGTENTYVGAHAGSLSADPDATQYAYNYGVSVGAETKIHGNDGTAVGFQAAIGTDPLSAGTTANYGTAVGSRSKVTVVEGIAIGYNAQATSYQRNIAIGKDALASGNEQALAVGFLTQAVGGYATAVGGQAGKNQTGAGNTFVGWKAGNDAAPQTYTNVTAVGASAAVDRSNMVQLGDTNVTVLRVGTHRITWSAAAPAAGTWSQGDVAWNSSAAVGQPKGWQCTVAGTPGTWVSMGNL
jgi:hypothetical protein